MPGLTDIGHLEVCHLEGLGGLHCTHRCNNWQRAVRGASLSRSSMDAAGSLLFEIACTNDTSVERLMPPTETSKDAVKIWHPLMGTSHDDV